jgi:hypothetical protein
VLQCCRAHLLLLYCNSHSTTDAAAYRRSLLFLLLLLILLLLLLLLLWWRRLACIPFLQQLLQLQPIAANECSQTAATGPNVRPPVLRQL